MDNIKRIINSCETMDQLINCRNWVERLDITDAQAEELNEYISDLRNYYFFRQATAEGLTIADICHLSDALALGEISQ